MVALPQTFKTSDLPQSESMPLLPEGQYQAVIVESGLEDVSAKNGNKYLWLKVIITQGQYAGTEFKERLNIINHNQQAVHIAYRTLARISEAVGMTETPKDSSVLHNKPFFIELKTEAGTPWKDKDGVERQGKDKSVINKYLAAPSTTIVSSPPTPASVKSAAPWSK
jgi:hypothetical protein